MSDGDSSGQRAYQATKDQILSGAVRGGQLLSEVEVAAALGVSRTPVHEAFLRLAAEDLLELLPRRGAVVVPVPPREATDLLEMRLALESSAVRRLCRTSDTLEALFAELTDLIGAQREGAAAGDEHRFAAADDAFHHRIVEAAGNAIALLRVTARSATPDDGVRGALRHRTRGPADRRARPLGRRDPAA